MKTGMKRLTKVQKELRAFDAALARLDKALARAAARSATLEARIVRMGEAAAKRR